MLGLVMPLFLRSVADHQFWRPKCTEHLVRAVSNRPDQLPAIIPYLQKWRTYGAITGNQDFGAVAFVFAASMVIKARSRRAVAPNYRN